MKVLRKLRQNRAETLVESLISILIVALSATMLLTAVTTASRLNQSARESQKIYQEAIEAAEAGTGAPGGTVTISGDLDTSIPDVTIYSNGGDFVRWSKP